MHHFHEYRANRKPECAGRIYGRICDPIT